jgi:hypothetical protein
MTIDMTSRASIETQEVIVDAAVTDAPPRPTWRRSTQKWQPRSIRVRWVRDRRDGGDWSSWSPTTHVRGPKILKSGLASAKMIHEDRFLSRTDPEFGQWIESTRPGAALPEPVPAAL